MSTGVDVSEKKKDIMKLLGKVCGQAIKKYGYDFDDIFQEVCLGIIIRNRGRGAFDPSRSSFGHYIVLVCNSVFRNYHLKEQRKRGREMVGIKNQLGETVDAQEMAVEETDEYPELSEVGDIDKYLELVSERTGDPRISWEIRTNKEKYRKILGGVIAGFSKEEISKMVGLSRPQMHKIIGKCRNQEEESNDDLGVLSLF